MAAGCANMAAGMAGKHAGCKPGTPDLQKPCWNDASRVAK
jgi:hypothetical protein